MAVNFQGEVRSSPLQNALIARKGKLRVPSWIQTSFGVDFGGTLLLGKDVRYNIRILLSTESLHVFQVRSRNNIHLDCPLLHKMSSNTRRSSDKCNRRPRPIIEQADQTKPIRTNPKPIDNLAVMCSLHQTTESL
ncbi:hypothetical protein Mapa_003399 [Marchantia paleacea]|nr:hypothetical protein Mapa_003399 [Marchantia paleacea]